MARFISKNAPNVNSRVFVMSAAFTAIMAAAIIGLAFTHNVGAATYTSATNGAVNFTAAADWTCSNVGPGPSCTTGPTAYPGGQGIAGDVATITAAPNFTVNTVVPGAVTLTGTNMFGGNILDIASGGSLTLTGSSAVTSSGGTETVSVSGGTLTNTGTLTFSGAGGTAVLALNGGTFNGAGTTNLIAGSNFNITGSQGAMTISQQSITNSGTTNFSANNTLTMSSGAAFSNTTSFNASGNGTIADGGGTPSFFNSGTLTKNVGGTFTLGVPFKNNGTASVVSSLVGMAFTGGSAPDHINSTWTIGGPGGLMNFGGAHTFSGTQTFTGGGTVTINAGGSWALKTNASLGSGLNFTNNGSLSMASPTAGTLSVAGGNYSGTGSYAPRLGVGGTFLGGSDAVNVTGTAALAGGTLAPVIAPGYTPAPGDTFTVMSFTSSTGTITYTPVTYPGGFFQLTNTGTQLQLAAVATADIRVTKTGPATVNNGTTASYTVTVTNLDTVNTASGITIQDSFTSGTVPSPPPGCTGGPASPLTCTIASLGPGASTSFVVNVVTNTPGVLTNTATRTASSPADPNTGNDSASITTTVNAASDLQVTSFTGAPSPTNAGSPVTYTVTLANNGPDPAAGVNFAFNLTGGGTITAASSPAFTCTNTATTASCTGGSVAVGSPVTLTVTATAPNNPAGPMTLSGTASVASDPNSANNSGSASITVNPLADVAVLKNPTGSFIAGQNVTWTIQVKNLGPSDAQNVTVTDTPGAGQTFVSNTGACTTAFPCNLGTLTSGSTVTITSTYALASSATGTATNTASATTTTPESSTGNNTATGSNPITVGADVAVTKTGPAGVSPGQNVTFTIAIINNGPSDATSIAVNDPTPANTTFVSATTSGGGCAPFPCTIPSLAPGATATIAATYSVATTATGSIVNGVNIVPGSPDPLASNNNATVTVPIVPTADLTISKNGPSTIVPGGTATFQIIVNNIGPNAASNVTINDSPSAGLTFLSATGGCTVFPCSVASLASGGNIIIAATYKVATNATTVTNTADVTSTTFDPNSANNTATITRSVRTPCPTAPPVAVFPTDANGNIPLSGTITWSGTGAASYDVYLGLAGNGCNTLVGNVTTTSFTYSGLQPNVDYEFRVVANAPSCTPQSSACVRLHTAQTPCALGTPTIISPQDGATITSPLKLQWTPVQGATSYHVVVVLNGSNVVDTTTTDTSLDVTIGNGSMTWMVSAVNATCAGSPATARFGVCSPPPPPLAGVVGAPSSGRAYQVIVTNPTADTTKYEYQEATNADFTDATSQTTAATTVTYQHDVGTSAQVFFYRVRAFNNCNAGGGGFSKTLRVVIVPNVVTTRPVVNVPKGAKDLVVEQLFVPGPAQPASFTVTVDKPWVVKIVPQFGTITPSGETISFYIDPTQLTNGTFTFTAIVTQTPLTESGRFATNGNTSKSSPVTVNIVTPVVPVDPTSPASNALVIPAVGHLVGLNSQWRSDIRVFNGSSQKLSYLLNFVSGTSTDVKQTTIDTGSGETTALDDIIHNWYGFGEVGDNASGVLLITPLNAPSDTTSALSTLVSSRTYNLANSLGTLGQFIPAVPLAQFVGSGGSRLSLQQIAQNSQYRSNFGVVEASGQPASVLLSMFRSDGSKLFDVPVNLNGGDQKQLNGLLAQQGVSTLSDGRMEVKVTGGDGKVTAYASVVDNASGDPLFVPGKTLGNSTAQLYVMPGVADLNTNSASWRTDMRVFNSGNAPQTATLTFFPEGTGGQPLTSAVTVNPGEVKVLDNILQSTFAAQNVGGAVHITTASDSQLVVTGRTYNQTAGGTLGQFIPAATLSDSIGVGGRALNILQVEDSVRYRANVGLAEMSGKPATVEISVVQPDTKVTPSIQLPLAANEFVQFPLSAFGLGDVYNVRVQVKVIDGGGNVTAYGSVIDQTTTAPTYIAAQ